MDKSLSKKPKLAYFSPLLPQKSKVADYSAEVLPELSRYYDIDVIVDQANVYDSWITKNLPIRNVNFFRKNARKYKRIVYSLGNSIFHCYIYKLLQLYPGVIVLHDFYLGELQLQLAAKSNDHNHFIQILFDSHGYTALIKLQNEGAQEVIDIYPCNRKILDCAIGIIVHSNSSKKLADQFYNKQACGKFIHIPFPASLPEYTEKVYQVIENFFHNSLCINSHPIRPKQILVDVSSLKANDSKTGISRVVRSILMALINDPPQGYQIEPIYAKKSKYFYARRFTLGLLRNRLKDDIVQPQRGDIYLGGEGSTYLFPSMEPWFQRFKEQGLRCYFILHDILPLQYPQNFVPCAKVVYAFWIAMISRISDGIICISRSVIDDYIAWLNQHSPKRKSALNIGYFHLGADIESSLPTSGYQQNAAFILEKILRSPTVLMVGTIAPRKAYKQAILAFEQLWAAELDINLVIIGQKGWRVDELTQNIDNHPENGNHLFWLRGVSDDMLAELYASSNVLLAASEAEGFGLPLIEAAKHGLPIIARNTPVFREVVGEHALYFSGNEPDVLAKTVLQWFDLDRKGKAPQSTKMPWLTWAKSVKQLQNVFLGNDHWCTTWVPRGVSNIKE